MNGIPYPAALAANIIDGQNPPYTLQDFRTFYPQFTEGIIPDEVLQIYLDLANKTVIEARWGDAWKLGMALFIAHFATQYVQTLVPDVDDPSAEQVVAQGTRVGVVGSKSVDGVSVSYDFSMLQDDLAGWAGWTRTIYGTQFATLARGLTGGMRYVW